MTEGVGDYVPCSPSPTLEMPVAKYRSGRGVTEGPPEGDAWDHWSQLQLLSTPHPTSEAQSYRVSFPQRTTSFHFPVEVFQGRLVKNTNQRIHLSHRHVK